MSYRDNFLILMVVQAYVMNRQKLTRIWECWDLQDIT